jgi:hypothetical protein
MMGFQLLAWCSILGYALPHISAKAPSPIFPFPFCPETHAQVAFIEACVAGEQLKAATHAVRVLGLGEAFPNIEALYRRRSLGRLLDKRLWPVALAFVGAEQELQVGGGTGGGGGGGTDGVARRGGIRRKARVRRTCLLACCCCCCCCCCC